MLITVHDCSFLFLSADCSNREVSERELERFQRQYKIIALPTSNVNAKRHAADPSVPNGRAAIEVCLCHCREVGHVTLCLELVLQ